MVNYYDQSIQEGRKLLILFLAGLGGIGIGYLLCVTGVCPLIKRIWTPSWALFSTGICCWILASLYLLIDLSGLTKNKVLKFFVLPLTVVGMNSIAIYSMEMVLRNWTGETIQKHFGADSFLIFGDLYEPMVRYTLIGFVFWLVCLWMYRQKIFVRI